MKRRHFIPALVGPALMGQVAAPPKRKGRVKQGITRGVFGRQVISRIAAKKPLSWGFAASISSARPIGRCSRNTVWFRRCIRGPEAPYPML